MHREQRGLTLIGWLFLLAPLAIVGYAAIRLTPIYLNYMKVARSMEQLAAEMRDDDSVSLQAIRSALERRLDIESVSYPSVKDIAIRRDGQVWVVQAAYDDVAPLFSNMSLLLAFDKTVQIE